MKWKLRSLGRSVVGLTARATSHLTGLRRYDAYTSTLSRAHCLEMSLRVRRPHASIKTLRPKSSGRRMTVRCVGRARSVPQLVQHRVESRLIGIRSHIFVVTFQARDERAAKSSWNKAWSVSVLQCRQETHGKKRRNAADMAANRNGCLTVLPVRALAQKAHVTGGNLASSCFTVGTFTTHSCPQTSAHDILRH